VANRGELALLRLFKRPFSNARGDDRNWRQADIGFGASPQRDLLSMPRER